MKKLLTAISVAALIGTPAFAADIAVKAPPPAPAPVTNWTGWYAGINFGGGWGTSNNATTTTTSQFDDLAKFFPGLSASGSTAGANAGTAALNQSGPIGGVQIGYNWQFSPLFVLGFEADIQGAAITSDRAGNTGTSTERFAGTSFFQASGGVGNEQVLAAFTNPALTASGFDSVTANLNWLGTVRARLGYLVTPNLLLYATGGLAYGGVTASDDLSTNFNLSADSFALAYAQAIGPTTVTALTVNAGPTPSATSAATSSNATNSIASTIHVAQTTPPSASLSLSLSGPGTSGSALSVTGTPTSFAVATATAPGGLSTTNYVQTSKPLSVALAQTAQSIRVSDTRVGGTIGGGFEWMMAPNWSFKAEALYYDLGSVTVTTTSTSSINPITAPISAVGPFSISAGGNTVTNTSIANQINKFTGAATVSNAASTRVNFQGVIIRLGLNYHFNWGG